MEPNAFIAEVYRRMSMRYAAEITRPSWEQMRSYPTVQRAVEAYRVILPPNKSAAILDVGFGDGWFLAACIELGYMNLFGLDFGIQHKANVKGWSPSVVELYEVERDIGFSLTKWCGRFDLIHMSHVIEHIPKHSLLYIVDSLYAALAPGGMLILRTPNMEGPCANSSYYVTLAHEYGFTGSNLSSLLSICNFDDVQIFEFRQSARSLRQRVGLAMRKIFVVVNKAQHRLFGVNYGGVFSSELVATARRGDRPPLLDERCR